MSTCSSSPSNLLSFLRASYPTTLPSSTSESDIPTLSSHLYPNITYTDSEKVELNQWLTTSARLATPDEDEAKHAERLGSLNIHLSTHTTLLGSKPCVADVALYHRLAPSVRAWSPEERTGEKGYHHIVRFMDFIQNAPMFGLHMPDADKIPIDVNDVRFVKKPLDAREEKERKKKEKAAAAALTSTNSGDVAQQQKSPLPDRTKEPSSTDSPAAPKSTPEGGPSKPKKEKKEKAAKPAKPPTPAKETPLSPSLIDLRVGHILQCVPHPNADTLYVSTIACGDAPGTPETSTHAESGNTVRTVCSGLKGQVPIEEMQGRKVVAVCNLKPVTMRGIKSAAMVLAASPRLKAGEEDDPHKGPVELVQPPETAQAGERVCFEGWEGEPEGMLNPKKKVWDMCQVGFTTTEEKAVGFDPGAVEQLKERSAIGVGRLVTKAGGVCTVRSMVGATVR